jgi:ribonucleoside-triphosphate reductase
MELREGMEEPKKKFSIQSTSKRVRMIFSVMASPNRIDILRILNSKGPLTYSELKSLAGFRSKKESGKFAYHLRKLLRQSLVALNKAERRYTITNLGKLVISLARQIEERSIIESGKMYVRTSHESIEEFNSHKIIQSLVREGNLPLELAQKITEEVENRIYKHQTAYLTGSLIRELVNSILLEHGHEEYRNKLARLGLPVFDVREMLVNVDNVDNGAEGLLFKAGKDVFEEYLITTALPKDVVDAHLSGDLHITNPGTWSLLPDTIFVNIKEMTEYGLDLGGKLLDVSRIPSTKTLDDLTNTLSIAISLLSKEASQEVVVEGLTTLLSKYSKNLTDLEAKLIYAFSNASTSSKYGTKPTLVSFRLQLGSDAKIINTILNAYKNYIKITPLPKIGLIIDYEKGKIKDISTISSEIILLGGHIFFSRGQASSKGIRSNAAKNTGSPSIQLDSISINLPRLAFESNKDETYFRARLALLMKPALSSMELRKKEISEITRRGLNPLLAKNTQYMQHSSISIVLNMIGLHEAVFNILGYDDDREGRDILNKVVGTAVDIAKKKGKDIGSDVRICMTETDGSTRFATLDGEKYGKSSIIKSSDDDSSSFYTEKIVLSSSEIDSITEKSEPILEATRFTKILSGGVFVDLQISSDTSTVQIKKAIEKTSSLTNSFKPSIKVAICGECGYKDEKLDKKCPRCKSPYII